jgi:uncharacterized protein (DUF736 family)
MPLYVAADTRTDVPSAASRIGFSRWHAFCCGDRLRLIRTSVDRPRRDQTPAPGSAIAIGPVARLDVSLPDLCNRAASRTVAVKTGRRLPPQAARSSLDGREHGASLDQVGNCYSEPVPSRVDDPVCPAGYRRPFFPCSSGGKSHRRHGGWTGSIHTLTINMELRFVPNDNRDNDNAPGFRVFVGQSRIGDGWEARSGGDNPKSYFRVRLDDPSLSEPISATHFPPEDGGTARLVWSRRKTEG